MQIVNWESTAFGPAHRTMPIYNLRNINCMQVAVTGIPMTEAYNHKSDAPR